MLEPTIRVYCAGKIGKGDWRHTLFPNLPAENFDHLQAEDRVAWEPNPPLRNGRLEYCGPWMFSDDHGCGHGENSHGVGPLTSEGSHGACCGGWPSYTPHEVMDACLRWIRRADALFVWLDSATAYGTLAEIGYATALGIPIYLYEPSAGYAAQEDVWFARRCCTHVNRSLSPVEAWAHFSGPEGAIPAFDYRMQRQWWFMLPTNAQLMLSRAFNHAIHAGFRTPADLLAHASFWLRDGLFRSFQESEDARFALGVLMHHQQAALHFARGLLAHSQTIRPAVPPGREASPLN